MLHQSDQLLRLGFVHSRSPKYLELACYLSRKRTSHVRFLVSEHEVEVISISRQSDLFTKAKRTKYKEALTSRSRTATQTAVIFNQRSLQSKPKQLRKCSIERINTLNNLNSWKSHLYSFMCLSYSQFPS
jgi:hypothetical protein